MKLKTLYITVFSLWFLSLFATGQNLAVTQKLADQYYQNGQYVAALSAYQRVAFFSRPVTDPGLLSRIADCFLKTNQLERALEYYDHAYFSSQDQDQKDQYLFSKILTYLQLENYHGALIELLSMNPDPKTPAWYRQQLYQGVAYFGLEQYDEAGLHFTQAIPDEQSALRASVANIFANEKNYLQPKPRTARILSIIFPGSGQLYAGDYVSAINSFVLTGIFVGLVVYLAINVHPVEAILTGSPWFQRYYQGGFEQAEETARKKRTENRNRIYHETLSLIQQSWVK